MNEIKVKDKRIFIIHQIVDFVLEVKKDRKQDTNKDYLLSKKIEKTRLYRKSKASLELLNVFNEFVEICGLHKEEIDNVVFDKNKKEFLDFILISRIRKILSFKYVIKLNDKYDLLFLPETPKGLIYNAFILFSADIEVFENEMIQYVNFINEGNCFKYLVLNNLIYCFLKLDPEFANINKLVETFNRIMSNQLERIVLKYKGETMIDNPDILIGPDSKYFSNGGNYLNLDFILRIKNIYKKLIQG